MPSENFSQQALTDRKLCQRSLYYLCKEILGYRDMAPHVHGDLCDFATSPRFGRFRQATVPRAWFKTWVWTVGKSIWLTLPDEEALFQSIYPFKGPNARILIASNVITNAEKMVNKIKKEWETNSRLRAAFPELIPDFNKTRWSDSCAQVHRPGNFTEGTYTAVGVGGSVISQHFDHIVEDDLIYAKKDDFTGMELMPNQEDIDNAIGWHKIAFSLFSDPNFSTMDNVGTRWAPHDLIDYIRRNEGHYQNFEICATHDAIWPIFDETYCVWPERYSVKALEGIRASQGAKIFECLPAGSPILMSDWTLQHIENIKIGDEVVGFSDGNSVEKTRLVKAIVNLVESQERDVVKVTLGNRDIIYCTADHPWYTGRKDKTHKSYLPAHVGGKLLQVYDCFKPIDNSMILDYRYLAGIIDGEGACNHGSIAIGQSKAASPDVYASIEAVLKRLNIPYKVAKVNPNDVHILRNKEIRRGLGESFVLGGGRQVKADILRFGIPAKSKRILNTIWQHPYHPIVGEGFVSSIEFVGKRTVYAIGTTSGNYVAYGYATKNTQYLNRPRAGEDVVFEPGYVIKHESIKEFPADAKYFTIVDVATWKDSKRICNNVVLTGCKDEKSHLWVARCDAGKFDPTQLIEIIKAHQKQFNSKVLIEEVGYQVAIRYYARLEMEKSGHIYTIEQLPSDNKKNAKVYRIESLQPTIKNGMFHIIASEKGLMSEMEDFPYGALVDRLDACGYLQRHAIKKGLPAGGKAPVNQFQFSEILREIEEGNRPELPFNVQLAGGRV